jgi:hypothetical protein
MKRGMAMRHVGAGGMLGGCHRGDDAALGEVGKPLSSLHAAAEALDHHRDAEQMCAHGQEQPSVHERVAEALESARGRHEVVAFAAVIARDAQPEHARLREPRHALLLGGRLHLGPEGAHALEERLLLRAPAEFHRDNSSGEGCILVLASPSRNR